ncbi:glycine betaine ABC transporter substrate-binding protein [Chloroflexota bacterium]
MHRVRLLSIFSSLLLSVTLLLTMFGSGCATPAATEKPTIKLIEGDWTSQIVLTEIFDQIISKQLGYPTEKVLLAVSMGWAAMGKGDVDIGAEIWLPGRLPEVQPYLDKGTVELAGEIYTGGSGWVVPRFVIEGDPARGIEPMAPDLKSILDLQTTEKGGKGYWQLFENPENPGKGEVIYGSPGWNVPDRWMILGYDLPLWESYQSEPIMMARMIAADKKGQPLLLSIWWPHWIFAEVDLVVLEEPDPFNEELIDYEKDPVPLKIGHPMYNVSKVVRTELKDTAPDVYRLVHNLVVGEDEINTIMQRVEADEEDMAVVAADWISQNQNKIDQWLSK